MTGRTKRPPGGAPRRGKRHAPTGMTRTQQLAQNRLRAAEQAELDEPTTDDEDTP